MKDVRNLQIFLTVCILVIISLVVTLVLINNKWAEMRGRTEKAEQTAKDAQQSESEAKRVQLKLKEIIGHRDEADLKTMEDAFEKDMDRYSQNNASAKTYRVTLANLANELVQKNEEHKNTTEAFNALKADYDNLNEMYATVVDQFSKERSAAIKDLADARKDFEGNLDVQRREFEKVRAENAEIKMNAEQQVKLSQDKAEANEKLTQQVEKRNSELASVLDDVRRTNLDRPDGKILSVNQQAGLTVIDLGSEDGLMTCMIFSVYNRKITGISIGTLDHEVEAVVCDVCKREASLNIAKASIEIVRILGPHKAEGRILDDQLTDPIVAGDVVYTPIWKPGQKQHFALGAGLRIPGIDGREGMSTRTSLEEIKRIIETNGGVVDCYISDGMDEGAVAGEIVGEITRNTTFLIIGDLNAEDQENQAIKSNDQMIKIASQMAVKQISLRELLARMSWKNVTPVRGFGKFASESDHAIAPSGGRRTSTSPVSQLYQLRNDDARITNADRGARSSTGTVTDSYKGTPKGAATESTGRASDLFRYRKPSANPE